MTRALLSFGSIAAFAILFVDGGTANAEKSSFGSDPSRNNAKILELFKPVIAKSLQSTVCVQIEGKQVAFGTIVDANGYILTKDSEIRDKENELKKDITVKFKDGKELPAKFVASNNDFDLAMLRVDAKNLTPIVWSSSKEAPVGHWVATTGLTDKPQAIGVVSVATRTMPEGPKMALPSGADRGWLGITLAPDESGGVRIGKLADKAAAEKAGLKVNDVIVAVNGKGTPDPQTLSALVGRHKAGESIVVRYRRDGEEDELTVKLEPRPRDFPQDRSEIQNTMGTSRSERRTGFPVTIQHDTNLKASQCGGPLIDIDGRVIGLNIARGGRTDTYAIPAESIQPLLADLMKGKSSVAQAAPKRTADQSRPKNSVDRNDDKRLTDNKKAPEKKTPEKNSLDKKTPEKNSLDK